MFKILKWFMPVRLVGQIKAWSMLCTLDVISSRLAAFFGKAMHPPTAAPSAESTPPSNCVADAQSSFDRLMGTATHTLDGRALRLHAGLHGWEKLACKVMKFLHFQQKPVPCFWITGCTGNCKETQLSNPRSRVLHVLTLVGQQLQKGVSQLGIHSAARAASSQESRASRYCQAFGLSQAEAAYSTGAASSLCLDHQAIPAGVRSLPEVRAALSWCVGALRGSQRQREALERRPERRLCLVDHAWIIM